MKKILIIGIGAGDPDQLTLQAVKALRSTDVFFILDKGEVKSDLVQLRRDILDAHIPQGSYRLVEARDPDRDRAAGGTAYAASGGCMNAATITIFSARYSNVLSSPALRQGWSVARALRWMQA